MRICTAFFAIAVSTLASSATNYADGSDFSRYNKRAVGYDLNDYGGSSKQDFGHNIEHDGSGRDLRRRASRGGGHHNKRHEHRHEDKGSSKDNHKKSRDGGGGSRHKHHDGKTSGAKVTNRSGGRVKPDGRMRVRCSPPDKDSRFVVDMVECFGDCCQNEDYCGEFIVNLGNQVPCLTEDSQEEDDDWDCDFQLTLPADALADALALGTADDGHGYRIRITDSNDDTYQSCSPPMDVTPPEAPGDDAKPTDAPAPCPSADDDDASEGSTAFSPRC